MLIDDGGGSAEAARRAAEEAARRAAEEAARKAAEAAARQAAADEAAEQAFRQRQADEAAAQAAQVQAAVATPPSQATTPPASAPVDTVVSAPPPNRFAKDDVYTPPPAAAPDAATYRVGPDGQLIAATPSGTTAAVGPVRDDWYHDPSFGQLATRSADAPPAVTQQLQQQYAALAPEAKAGISESDYVAQAAEEYQAAFAARGQAAQKVDAQIAAAMDEGGPSSREAQMLLHSRDRRIDAEVRTAVQDFRDERDARALAERYASDPLRWQQVAQQYNIDPERQPTTAVLEQILTTSRRADEQAQIAGQIAVNGLPPGSTAADIEAARQRAAAGARLDTLLDGGLAAPPEGVDKERWVAEQANLVGETERERQLALQAGKDPDLAVQQSERLFELRLGASLRDAQAQGATPDQLAAYEADQLKQFRLTVDIANRNGISMAEAQERVGGALDLQSRRIAAQVQINAEVEAYNASTTAFQRGGEAIRGMFYGDGVNHLEWAQEDFARTLDLEKRYTDLALRTEGPLSDAQKQELARLRQQIDGRIQLDTQNVGLNVDHSLAQAAMYKPVESALFQTIYTASSVIPGGIVIGASVKLLLDDLPNGRIRTNGDVYETGQDVLLSMAVGAGNVAINKLDPTHKGATTILRAGADPILEKGAQVALESGVNALWTGTSNVLDQLHDPTRAGAGVDWQSAGETTMSSFYGGMIGGSIGKALPAVDPANVAANVMKDTTTGLLTGTLMDAGRQYSQTGQVDLGSAALAGTRDAAVGGFLGGNMAFVHGQEYPAGTGSQAGEGRPPAEEPALAADERPLPGAAGRLAPDTPVAPGAGLRDDAGNPVDPDSLLIVSGRAPALDPMLAGERPEQVPEEEAPGAGEAPGGLRLFEPDWMPAHPSQSIEWETYMETQHGARYVAVHPDTVDQPNAFFTENRQEVYDNINRIVSEKVHPDDSIDLSVTAGDPFVKPERIPPPGPVVLVGGYLSRDHTRGCVADQMATLRAQGYDVIPHPYAIIYTEPAATSGSLGRTAQAEPLASSADQVRDRFLAAAADPGEPSWSAVLTAVGGTPIPGEGMGVFGELKALGYRPAATPRPGDVAVFVEDLRGEGGTYDKVVRHAAIVSAVGTETSFLSSNLTRATPTTQGLETPGEYSFSEMRRQDPGLDRTQVVYLRPATAEGSGVTAVPPQTSGLTPGKPPVAVGQHGPVRVLADETGPRLVDVGGRPPSLTVAGEAVASLMTDPRSPVLVTSRVDPGAPARALSSVAQDHQEGYFAVYYDPRTGSVRAEQVTVGQHLSTRANADLIDAGARPGEVPLAGFHNHASPDVAPSDPDFFFQSRVLAEMQERHGVDFRNFIARMDDGRPVLTEFGGPFQTRFLDSATLAALAAAASKKDKGDIASWPKGKPAVVGLPESADAGPARPVWEQLPLPEPALRLGSPEWLASLRKDQPVLRRDVFLTNLDEYEARAILRSEGGWTEGLQQGRGYEGQPKWTREIDGVDHEVRMHPTPTRTNWNIKPGMGAYEGPVSRYGVELVPGGLRSLPKDWKPGDPLPPETQAIFDMDDALRRIFGDQAKPMPGWGLHYLDPFGHAYVNEEGFLVGVASEHGHTYGKYHPELGPEPWRQSPYQPGYWTEHEDE